MIQPVFTCCQLVHLLLECMKEHTEFWYPAWYHICWSSYFIIRPLKVNKIVCSSPQKIKNKKTKKQKIVCSRIILPSIYYTDSKQTLLVHLNETSWSFNINSITWSAFELCILLLVSLRTKNGLKYTSSIIMMDDDI